MKSLRIALTALVAAGFAGEARAALDQVGPPIAPHGFPAFYESAGLKLELCLPPPAGNAALRSDLCIFDPPAAGPLQVGGEVFWWMASAQPAPLVVGGNALVEFAVEGTFTEEEPVDGKQMVFLRLRIRADVPSDGTYKVTHPFGALTFANVLAAEGINYTADIGNINVLDPAASYVGTLAGVAGPFLTWPGYAEDESLRAVNPATGAVERYVGDPNVPHVVTGGTNGNVVKLELVGSSDVRTETDLWSVMGKVYDPDAVRADHVFPPPPTPKLFAAGPVNRGGPVDLGTDPLRPEGIRTATKLGGFPVGYPTWYQEAVPSMVEDPANPGTLVPEKKLDPNTGEPVLDPITGEPVIVMTGGLKLTYCPGTDPMCISVPPAPGDPLQVGDESFWWTAEASVAGAGVDGLLVLALEGAFGGDESMVDKNQVVFARLRIRVDVPVAGKYTVTHPYGVEEFEAVLDPRKGGKRAINTTRDVMMSNPVNPDITVTGALFGSIGPRFLTWPDYLTNAALKRQQPVVRNGVVQEDGAGNTLRAEVQYVGDPAIPHVVTGSPRGTNYFRIQGPGGIDVRTELFAVTGKVYDPDTFESAVDPDAPVAHADQATLDLATGATSVALRVLDNDEFAPGAPVTVEVLPAGGGIGPVQGTAVVNADGTVTYTPNAGFGGIDTFAYQITDSTGLTSASATVTVTVVPVETLAVSLARFDAARLRLDVRGTSNFEGAVVSIYGGATAGGAPLGTAVVANGRWRYRGSATSNITSISVASSTGKASLLDQAVQSR